MGGLRCSSHTCLEHAQPDGSHMNLYDMVDNHGEAHDRREHQWIGKSHVFFVGEMSQGDASYGGVQEVDRVGQHPQGHTPGNLISRTVLRFRHSITTNKTSRPITMTSVLNGLNL